MTPADPPELDPTLLGLRRTPTQARSREKVQRALVAAERLIEREGVGALTLPRVAEEAGISVGALYQFLPDRDAVVAALTALYHQRHEANMDHLMSTIDVTSADDPVAAIILGVADVYRAQRHTRVLRSELQAATDPAMTRGHKLRQVAKITGLLESVGIATGDQAALVARTIFFAADGVMHEAFAESDDGNRDLLGELVTMVRAYLSTHETS